MTTGRPALPSPQAINVDTRKTALLVLDLSEICAHPGTPFNSLVPGITRFLERARTAGIPIIFTISPRLKGTTTGRVYSRFSRRPSEPEIFPGGFDKFTSGELESFLKLHDVDTLIITGCRSNICVLYTATKAVSELGYKVIIPIDGMSANTEYEEEYTIFQLTTLPGGAAERISFAELDKISFG